MSEILEELILKRKQQALDYKKYLRELVELTKRVKQLDGQNYPEQIKISGQKALYDNLDKDDKLAQTIDETVKYTAKDGWRDNKIKEREVKRAIKRKLPENFSAKDVLDVIKNQDEYWANTNNSFRHRYRCHQKRHQEYAPVGPSAYGTGAYFQSKGDGNEVDSFVCSFETWLDQKTHPEHAGAKSPAGTRILQRESHYFQGQRYLLNIIEHEAPPKVEIRNKKYMDSYVRPGSE